MCGITGFFSQGEISLRGYYEAHASVGHRGPDDEGFYVLKKGKRYQCYGEKTVQTKKDGVHINEIGMAQLCLGHHRLSILDLSDNGHQPLCSEDKRYTIIYNGEIYNYIEIREELEALGHTFNSNTDTEVILAAFSRWREKAFPRFNGMWALAIYDSLQSRVFFSRDRFGIKPLYLYQSENSVYFASELRFFKKMGLPLTLNVNSAMGYLTSCSLDVGQETFYNEVNSFPAASYVVYSLEGKKLEEKKYWNLNMSNKWGFDYDAAKEEVRRIFHSSLALRQRSDVPVGTLLSGGLDSTAIVCSLSRDFELHGGRINAFSAVFSEEKFSEYNYIEDTVKLFPDVVPHYIYPSVELLKDNFTGLLETLETPFRSLAAFSQNLLYKNISENSDVVVLLNGQGSDELFAGYTNHYPIMFAELLRSGKWKDLYDELCAFRENRESVFWVTLQQALKLTLPGFLREPLNNSKAKFKVNLAIFSGDFKRPDKLQRPNLKQTLSHDLLVSALPEYLRYEDRNSMAYSLEARLPFLDYRLVELAFSLPTEFKIHKGINKRVFREALWDNITPSVRDRKDKMGFVSPQEVWQKTIMKNWMNEVIMSVDSSGLFCQLRLESEYQKYLEGDASGNTWLWWRVFCFKFWHKYFLEN